MTERIEHAAEVVKCPICGRFMRRGGYYTNDHDDSWQDTWKCGTPHPTPEQRASIKALAQEARQANTEREARELQSLFDAARNSASNHTGKGER